jgi:hypothetical protein
MGCDTPVSPAQHTVTSFYAAIDSSDWSTGCALLAPRTRSDLVASAGTPCGSALADEDLSDPGAVVRVQRFGTMAQVRLTDDTVFASRFADGWKVTAAGCAPVPGHPYDCRLQG